ncbi:MAG: carbohydrate-binding protein [Cytophagales bacterium]|nr:carbohydrate-binding protein [Cytophagales bacterium]
MNLNLTKKLGIALLGASCSFHAIAQQVNSSITSWKNNTQGAYSIIHDDYGSGNMTGIQNTADTIASNRGLKFTFGVITGSTNGQEYQRATQMITQHNHEVINHSHSHYCLNRHPDCSWEGQFYWGEDDFERELSQSTNLIQQNTSYTPRFFIYPFDVGSPEANKYLKDLGYIGSRTGTKNLVGLNYNNFTFGSEWNDPTRFYKTNFIVFDNGLQTSLADMNKVVTDAIANNAWGNRELHNVGYLGHSNSWGEIATDMYRDHMDFVKQKVDAGELWMATVSEVLTYQTQKNAYTPNANYSAQDGEITVSWNTPSFSVQDYLAPLQVKSPITLKVNVTNLTNKEEISVTQNGINKEYWIQGNDLYTNIYPHEGNVIVGSEVGVSDCPTICVQQDLEATKSIDAGSNLVLSVQAKSDETIFYQWYKNAVKINGETQSTLVVANAEEDDAGTYYVELSNQLGLVNSSSVDVTIIASIQTPFDGLIMIPGRLEAENFDEGGPSVAYNDITVANQGGSGYRETSVDIETISDASQIGVGYVVRDEWLEYSVDIANNGKYALSFRTASETTDGSLAIYVDGEKVGDFTGLLQTGGWNTWTTTKFSDIELPAGEHVLRIEFTSGDFNINYVDFELEEVISAVSSTNEKLTQVYPNPFSDDLTVKFVQTPEAVRVVDILGNVIESHDLEGDEFELNLVKDAPAGVYIVQFEYNDHTELVRVVKQ